MPRRNPMRSLNILSVCLVILLVTPLCQGAQADRDKCVGGDPQACIKYSQQVWAGCSSSPFMLNCAQKAECCEDRGLLLSQYNNSCASGGSNTAACANLKKQLEDNSPDKCDNLATPPTSSISGYIRKNGEATVLLTDIGNHILKIANQDAEIVNQNVDHHVIVTVAQPSGDTITISSVVWSIVFADASGKLLTLQDRQILDQNVGLDKGCGDFDDSGSFAQDFKFTLPPNTLLGDFRINETSGAGPRSWAWCITPATGLQPAVFHVNLHIERNSQCFMLLGWHGPSTWVHVQVTLYRKFVGEPPAPADKLTVCPVSGPAGGVPQNPLPPSQDIAVISQLGGCTSDGATSAFFVVNHSSHLADVELKLTINNSRVSSRTVLVPAGQQVFLGCNASVHAGEVYRYDVASVTWKN